MSRIARQREKTDQLVVDQLMEDIELLIQLEQVFIHLVALDRHLGVSLLQASLQLIASLTIEHLCIGTGWR